MGNETFTVNKTDKQININDFTEHENNLKNLSENNSLSDSLKNDSLNNSSSNNINDKISQLQAKLRETDQTIIESLKNHFEDDQIAEINKQLHVLYAVIAHTEDRYKYSKDYRDGIDTIMGLVISGKFLLNDKRKS